MHVCNNLTKNCRKTKIGTEVVHAMADIPHHFQDQQSRSRGRYIFGMGRPTKVKLDIYGRSSMTRITHMCGDLKGQIIMSRHQFDEWLPVNRQQKVAEAQKLAARLSVPRPGWHYTTIPSQRPKVKVSRPLWVVAQVTNCSGCILWLPQLVLIDFMTYCNVSSVQNALSHKTQTYHKQWIT